MKKLILFLLLISFQASYGQQWEWINNGFDTESYSNVEALVVNDGKLLVKTDIGLFISTDMGNSWKERKQPDFEIKILKVFDNKIFAGTEGDGLYYSTDNGDSWGAASIDAYFVNTAVSAGTKYYAGTRRGVYSSSDKGITWKNIGLSDTIVTSIILTEDKIYAITAVEGIFLSNDSGKSWKQTSLVNDVKSAGISGNKLFAGTSKGVLVSTDDGATWDTTNLAKRYGVKIYSSNNRIIAAAKKEGIAISNDNGSSWYELNLYYTEIFTIESSGSNIFLCTNRGFYLSTNNGDTWSLKGMPGEPVTKFTFKGDQIFVKTKTNKIYSSNKDVIGWNKFPELGHLLTGFDFSGNDIFAGTNEGIYLLKDKEFAWEQKGLEDKYITSITVSGSNIFAGTWKDGVYISTDQGNSWNKTSIATNYIPFLISDETKIFAVSEDSVYQHTIFVSKDNGITWINQGICRFFINLIEISGGSLYSYGDNYAFMSSNDGAEWEYIDNLKDVGLFAINGNKIFVEASYGVFQISSDKGITWTKIQTNNLDYRHISNIAIDDEYVYFSRSYYDIEYVLYSGYTQEIYRAKISDITSVTEEFQTGINVAVFPNPAEDFISLKIPDSSILAGNQNIEIISPLGIKVLETKFSEQINVSSLARGAYYLKVGNKAYMFVKK